MEVEKAEVGPSDGDAPPPEAERPRKKKTVSLRKGVVRKKASTIAEEKAQRAKEREEEARRKEIQEQQQTPSPEQLTVRKGLQVVFDPSLGENQSGRGQGSGPTTTAPPDDPGGGLDRKDKFPRGRSEEERGEDYKKRRMGALSQMVTKGKGGKRSITQMRADEEMKSYGVMIGKVNYTPVGRKKVHLGPSEKTKITEAKEGKRYVNVQGSVTGAELAKKLKVKFKDFAAKAMDMNLLIKSGDHLGLYSRGAVGRALRLSG